MGKQNGKTNKLLDFLAGKGFYVVLILCVAAIGVSGYMLFFGGTNEPADSPSLALTSPVITPERPAVSIAPQNPAASPAVPSAPPRAVQPSPSSMPQGNVDPYDAQVGAVEDGESVETAANVPQMPAVPPESPTPASNNKPDFFSPVSGALIVKYSESADVFFEYLREWRYHPGVDLETGEGALVQAAADGEVEEVLEDTIRNMGVSVVITHSGGYKTVYSNLSPEVTVKTGQKVQAGDTIGAVGNTSVSEQSLPPHLHFEILKDGEPVDPMDYLPKAP